MEIRTHVHCPVAWHCPALPMGMGVTRAMRIGMGMVMGETRTVTDKGMMTNMRVQGRG